MNKLKFINAQSMSTFQLSVSVAEFQVVVRHGSKRAKFMSSSDAAHFYNWCIRQWKWFMLRVLTMPVDSMQKKLKLMLIALLRTVA